uniref:T-cell surface glycoprotein CD1b-like n=1 Tax=Marmota marmota marmota TaxID=9994 RepID=A0A8C6A7V8_MARMA
SFYFPFLLLCLKASQGPTSFHAIQISSFVNSTWSQNQASGWLEDLQIHGWDSEAGTAIFLKPWAKVKPEAWLSSGPSPGPDRMLLVCHVSGFYPKHMWVMWMRGEQEQEGTQRSDFLPNADGTWYLQATLDVASGDTAGLACRVKHSSLGGQDLILHWGHPLSIGLVILAIIVSCALIFLGLAFLPSLWVLPLFSPVIYL